MTIIFRLTLATFALLLTLTLHLNSQVDENCLCVPVSQSRTIIGYDSCAFYELILDEVDCNAMLSSQYCGFFIGNTDSSFLYGKRFASFMFGEVVFDQELSDKDTILTIDDLNDNVNKEIIGMLNLLGNEIGKFNFYVRSNSRAYLNFNEHVSIVEVKKFLTKNLELLNNNNINFQLFSLEKDLTSTTVEDIGEVSNSQLQAYYSNGILEVNSNSEVLKSIQIFDLYGNKISSINSLNTQNYNINTKLSSGLYFVLVNEKQTIKLSITE